MSNEQKIDKRVMVPTDVYPETGCGHYDFIEQPQDPSDLDAEAEQIKAAELDAIKPEEHEPTTESGSNVEDSRQKVVVEVKQLSRWRIKTVAIVLGGAAAIGAIGAGVMYLKDHMPHLPEVVEADHDLAVEVNDVETIVEYDKSLNFIKADSTFDYKQKTSLDRRFLPSNCDTEINQTMEAESRGEITLEKVTTKIYPESAKIEIEGEPNTESFLDISKNNIVPNVAVGGVDVCAIDSKGIYDKKGNERPDADLDELDWATKIAIINTGNAADLSFACAIQKVGEPALVDAVKKNASLFSPKIADMDPEDIEVVYKGDYTKYADGEVDKAVAEFYTDFEDISDRYMEVTGDHTNPDLEASLTECPEQDITVSQQ